MTNQQRSTLRQRLLPFTAAALTLGAMVAFSQLSTNAGSASAKPATPDAAPLAASAPGSNVITNNNPGATAQYWTKAKTQSAKELVPTRTDAGASSYGSSALDFTRSRITPQSANLTYPYRTTGKIFFTKPGVGDFQCSGSVVAKRVVITAAHCLYGEGHFYTNWVFIPGYDGSRSTLAQQRPLGTWTWNRGQVPTNWINTGGSLPNRTDFASLVLNDQVFGSTSYQLYQKAGRYTFAVNHLFDTAVTMLGYPCNFDSCNIMQRVDSSDHRVPPGYTGGNAYEYGSDMTGGSSGGPWLENFGTGAAPQGSWTTRNAVVGVTSYIYTDGGASLIEGASQLNSDWTTIYNATCAAASGNC